MQEGTRNLLYFAYGEHMSEDEMLRAFPHARMAGLARLDGYALCFTGRDGAAKPGIEPHEGASVPGRVWSLPETEIDALDSAIGGPTAARREIRSMNVGGMNLPVLVYVTTPGQTKGRPGFLDYTIMQEAYQAAGEDTAPLVEAAKKAAP